MLDVIDAVQHERSIFQLFELALFLPEKQVASPPGCNSGRSGRKRMVHSFDRE